MFIKKLYYQWRSMFWALMILIMFQVIFMFKGIESVPFFLYHMFSTKHEVQQKYPVIAVKIDSDYYDHTRLSNREYELIIGAPGHYGDIKRAGEDPVSIAVRNRVGSRGEGIYNYFLKQLTNDSTAINNFPAWWARYFSKVSGIRNKFVSVVSIDVTYSPELKRVSSDSILFTVKLPDAD